MDGTILVADDDRTIRTVLTQALTRAGCKVHATSSLVTLMRWVEEGKGDLVISDVMMPDGNGLETLPLISERRPGLPVIVISAQNTIMTAIQAAEADAFDYLPKPFDLPDLMKRAARALEAKRRAAPPMPVRDTGSDDLPLVGRTPAMQSLYRLVARVMNTDLPMLITGESGTGKSLLARAIHDLSDRRTEPLVLASSDDLSSDDHAQALVSRARSGTIVLEEIGDFDQDAQARLTRILDRLEGQDGPRIMATSRTDLSAKLNEGLREDLFYRLSGVTVAMPALRERIDDIAPLTEHFLARAEKDGAPTRALSGDAMNRLRSYSWPGNVRQLENAVRRLVLTSMEAEITLADVDAVLSSQPAMEPVGGVADGEKLSASVARHLRRYFDLHGGVLPPPGLYPRILRETELPLIEIALDATGGNQAKCADLLGINRNTLRKKITELDISVARRRKLM